jgi:hypothetical protein
MTDNNQILRPVCVGCRHLKVTLDSRPSELVRYSSMTDGQWEALNAFSPRPDEYDCLLAMDCNYIDRGGGYRNLKEPKDPFLWTCPKFEKGGNNEPARIQRNMAMFWDPSLLERMHAMSERSPGKR